MIQVTLNLKGNEANKKVEAIGFDLGKMKYIFTPLLAADTRGRYCQSAQAISNTGK